MLQAASRLEYSRDKCGFVLRQRPDWLPKYALLSRGEFEVFLAIVKGTETRLIARQRGVSTKTIQTMRLRILDKMEAANNAELTMYAILYRLIEPPREILG